MGLKLESMKGIEEFDDSEASRRSYESCAPEGGGDFWVEFEQKLNKNAPQE